MYSIIFLSRIFEEKKFWHAQTKMFWYPKTKKLSTHKVYTIFTISRTFIGFQRNLWFIYSYGTLWLCNFTFLGILIKIYKRCFYLSCKFCTHFSDLFIETFCNQPSIVIFLLPTTIFLEKFCCLHFSISKNFLIISQFFFISCLYFSISFEKCYFFDCFK